MRSILTSLRRKLTGVEGDLLGTRADLDVVVEMKFKSNGWISKLGRSAQLSEHN